MTLDELIAGAQAMRARLGGEATVLLMTPHGYSAPMLVESISLAGRDGHSEPVVIIGPGEKPDILGRTPNVGCDDDFARGG